MIVFSVNIFGPQTQNKGCASELEGQNSDKSSMDTLPLRPVQSDSAWDNMYSIWNLLLNKGLKSNYFEFLTFLIKKI